MLQDLLSEDNVSFHYPAETWEEVIRHGGQLMVDAGDVYKRQVNSLIEILDATDTGESVELVKAEESIN